MFLFRFMGIALRTPLSLTDLEDSPICAASMDHGTWLLGGVRGRGEAMGLGCRVRPGGPAHLMGDGVSGSALRAARLVVVRNTANTNQALFRPARSGARWSGRAPRLLVLPSTLRSPLRLETLESYSSKSDVRTTTGPVPTGAGAGAGAGTGMAPG